MIRWYRFSAILVLAISLAIAQLLALFTTLQASQDLTGVVFCVVPPGEPTGPFAACNEVFTQIQDAVDTAVGGEEIWVAMGVYTDVHEYEGLQQMVYLDKALTLRGGYTPPFTAPPDPVVNPTVLDAGGQGRVVYITGTAVTLSNFRITGGNATGLGPESFADRGGGVYAVNADLTLNNTVIYSNTASLNGGSGGGVGIQNGAITMTANIIKNNLAGYVAYGAGGGISVQDSDFYLFGNTILSNTAVFTGSDSFAEVNGVGGGIAIRSSSGYLVNNHLEGNVALQYGQFGLGGGIYLEQDDQVTQSYQVFITGNLIHRNIGAIHPVDGQGGGGGIWLRGGSSFSGDVPLQATFIHNMIQENVAAVSGTWGFAGGVAVLHNTILTFTHNTVMSNTGLISGEDGQVGGLVTANVTGTLAYNRFIGNVAAISATSGYAGGLYFYQSQIDQHHDLIQGNVANQNGAGYGGGIIFNETAATLTSVVVTDNRADTKGAALWLGAADVTLLHPTLARNVGDNAVYLTTGYGSTTPSVMTLTNGLLSNHDMGIAVTDNNTATIHGVLWHDTPIAIGAGPLAHVTIDHQIVGDPLFAADGYHILPGSAAIGQGIPVGNILDIDGEPRPPIPDLGADQYWFGQWYLPVVMCSP